MLKEFTLGELYDTQDAFKNIVNIEPPPPAVVGYKLAKLAIIVGKEIQAIGQARDSLIRKYGQKNDDNTFSIEPSMPRWAEYVTEYEQLMSQKTKVEYDRVRITPDMKVPVKYLIVLDPFIELEPEKEEPKLEVVPFSK